MTGQLRTTLHTRADALDPFDLDLDAIVRDGERLARRRRMTWTGGLAAAAAAAVAVTAVVHHTSDSALQISDVGPGTLTYAVGSVLHVGDRSVDLGVDIRAYVPISGGVVFTDPGHQVYVADSSSKRRIGRIGRSESLVADDVGTTVAWLDGHDLEVYRSGQQGPTSVALDATVVRQGVMVNAVSGGAVWLSELHGVTTYTVASGRLQQVARTPGSEGLMDVANGHALVYRNSTIHGGAAGTAVVPVSDLGTPFSVQVTDAVFSNLSPDARHWYTSGSGRSDQFAVLDTATDHRRVITARNLGFAYLGPYAWLGDDTVTAIAFEKASATGPVTLLTCQVSTGHCAVAARDIGTSDQIALAMGTSLQGP